MKILCVLYDDPKGGMPKSYPLSELPKLEKQVSSHWDQQQKALQQYLLQVVGNGAVIYPII